MADAVRSGPEEEIVMFVHELQLLVSSASAIVPVLAAELLSAQARTEYVPVVLKVYEGEVMERDAPAARAEVEAAARSVMVPPPLAAEATWKKLEKEFTVEALPTLDIVEENV